MASVYDSVSDKGKYREYIGIAGVNDEDVVIETTDVSRFDTFMLSSGAGTMQVEAHDGQQWLTSALSLGDLGATDTNPVLVTAALRQYGFRGFYQKIRVTQEGATAVTGAVLRCSKS